MPKHLHLNLFIALTLPVALLACGGGSTDSLSSAARPVVAADAGCIDRVPTKSNDSVCAERTAAVVRVGAGLGEAGSEKVGQAPKVATSDSNAALATVVDPAVAPAMGGPAPTDATQEPAPSQQPPSAALDAGGATTPVPTPKPITAPIPSPVPTVASAAAKVFVSTTVDTLRPTPDALTSHAATSTLMEVGTGVLGQPMLRMLPKAVPDAYGGEASFTMKVDPLAQNHITFKLWGEEPSNGRYVLECDGYEVWGRRSPVIDQWSPVTKNRFWYRTVALPLHLTRGREQVRLRLRSMGYINPYAALQYSTYQKPLTGPSQRIYGIWVHTDPYVAVPAGEFQPGDAKPARFAVESKTTQALLDGVKTNHTAWVRDKLASTTRLSLADLKTLGLTYALATQIRYYKDPALIARFVNDVDSHIAAYYADPGYASADWGGSFQGIAYTLLQAWDAVKGRMDETIDVGGGRMVERRTAWAKAFQAGIDGERYTRRTVTNQILEANAGIYRQHRALRLMGANSPFTEPQARRYIDEAAGLLPFSGPDLANGGSAWPFGPNYNVINPEGTTREPGWVGSDYGGMEHYLTEFWQLTGDTAFRDKALKMAHARSRTTYFGDDGGTGYSAMRITDPINTRNDYLPGRPRYVDFELATATLDPTLIAYAQQQIDEGQFWGSYWRSLDPRFLDQWALFAAQPRSGAKLPATPGQPDYAWADVDDHIVTIKHGDEFLAVNMYRGLFGQARVFLQSPNGIRHADVVSDDTAYVGDGSFTTGDGRVDTDLTLPPDNPTSANYGMRTPLTSGENGDCPMASSACNRRPSANTLRFGPYWIGMNSSSTASYAMKLPTNFKSGVDLVSGKTLTNPIVLAPRTTVAFYVTAPSDGELPSRPMFFTAAPGNGQTVLAWDAPARATHFSVRRATAEQGPYDEIAANVADTAYADRGVSNGTAYYYKVAGTNASGAGGESVAVKALPLASRIAAVDGTGDAAWSGSTAGNASTLASPSMAAPWSFQELSDSVLKGTASMAAGTVTVKTASYNVYADAYKRADDFAFVFQPHAGDGTVVARIASAKAANASSQSGLAIRGSLAANSAGAGVFWANGKVTLGYRTVNNQLSKFAGTVDGYPLPCWLQLTRRGRTITGSVSKDGSTWVQVGTVSILDLTDAAYFGLAASGNNRGTLSTSVFDGVAMGQ